MEEIKHTAVCQRTERKDERVRLRNLKTGEIGMTFGCTTEGGTIQIELKDGTFDSWVATDCKELEAED